MKIPGIGNIRNLTNAKARNAALSKLKKAGIRRGLGAIKGEYEDWCSSGNRTEADKIGFLGVLKILANPEAKVWVKKEKLKQIRIRIENGPEDETTKKQLNKRLELRERKINVEGVKNG